MNRTLLKSKHSCKLSADRRIFFLLLLFLLWNISEAAVQVKTISTNYAAKTVTFSVSWAAGTRDATHLSKVWVFVDYQEVTNPNTTGWQRANIDLSKLPANSSADGANTKGFWYQGQATAAQNATITVTLTNVPTKFNWCAVATDYPPNAAVYDNGTYTLKGTQPFIVNGTAIVGNKFIGIVNSLTDATGCPGWIECDVATANGTCHTGLTLVNGYCRDLIADKAVKFTGCGYELEVKLAQTIPPAIWDINVGCPSGWVPATRAQIKCFYKNARVATNTFANTVYQTAEYYGTSGLLAPAQGCNRCTGGSYWSISCGVGQVSNANECTAYAPCLICAQNNGGYEYWARCANTNYKMGAKCVR